jgi:hypothetical protein
MGNIYSHEYDVNIQDKEKQENVDEKKDIKEINEEYQKNTTIITIGCIGTAL